MKIISLAWRKRDGTPGSDFAFCLVNDDMAVIHAGRIKTADTGNLFHISTFSPDAPMEMLDFVKMENAPKVGRCEHCDELAPKHHKDCITLRGK